MLAALLAMLYTVVFVKDSRILRAKSDSREKAEDSHRELQRYKDHSKNFFLELTSKKEDKRSLKYDNA